MFLIKLQFSKPCWNWSLQVSAMRSSHGGSVVPKIRHRQVSSGLKPGPANDKYVSWISKFNASLMCNTCEWALATERHCIHSWALDPSLALSTNVLSGVKISKALGILRRPSLETFTDRMEPTSNVWVSAHSPFYASKCVNQRNKWWYFSLTVSLYVSLAPDSVK